MRKGKANDKNSQSNGLEPISAAISGPAPYTEALHSYYEAKYKLVKCVASRGSLLLHVNVVKHHSCYRNGWVSYAEQDEY